MFSFIKEIVKNHFKDMDLSDIAQEIEEQEGEIEDILDFDKLTQKIVAGLEECSLTFRPHPLLEGNKNTGFKLEGVYTCPTCYRPHGVWKNEISGSEVDPNLLVNGRKIIVADNL